MLAPAVSGSRSDEPLRERLRKIGHE
ncbi:hypothetical protein FHY06_002949 [Variovorax sp. BK613]|nr:hypothetical protein [Variovorax sp. BK613]